MNFIYDIVLNFNKNYYNFFEWNKKDNITNIKKIPLFLVDKDTYEIMKYDNVTVDSNFIEVIRDKTFTFSRVKLGPSCLITNGKEVLGLLFKENGMLIKRSSLLLDEEDEVIDEAIDNDIYKIEIIKHHKLKHENVNRIEKEKKEFLIKYINKEKSDINLKYLYYDYFEKEENNINVIKNNLIKEIKDNWNRKFDNFYETVMIFNKIKN